MFVRRQRLEIAVDTFQIIISHTAENAPWHRRAGNRRAKAEPCDECFLSEPSDRTRVRVGREIRRHGHLGRIECEIHALTAAELRTDECTIARIAIGMTFDARRDLRGEILAAFDRWPNRTARRRSSR